MSILGKPSIVGKWRSNIDTAHKKKLEEAHRDYLLNKIVEYRKFMVISDRFTEEDIHEYDKHFGII